jgi:dephospho-CoA kinase
VFVVALTGNYGMGKSYLLSLFRETGIVTIDSDEIVRSLFEKKEVKKQLKQLFGDDVFDDDVPNRRKIADLVFKDASLRRDLEDILHPLVFRQIEETVSVNRGEELIVAEVPLLFERNYQDRFDRSVAVYTSEETALDRMEQAGVNRRSALLRLKSQMPVEEKIKRADYVINNGGTPEDTLRQWRLLLDQLKKEAKQSADSAWHRRNRIL